ncbi:MAG TPA: peptide chain release factor N(5)-glutamine methyltransferase [Conexibacter sp.]
MPELGEPQFADGPSVRMSLAIATAELRDAGCDTPRLDAELLLADALGATRTQLHLAPERELTLAESDRFAELLRRRRAREPVAYVLGKRAFRYIELTVDERVLVPRPESEGLVEAALKLPPGARVVDVGTGSGAIALALKHERPDLEVIGADVSADALAVARANADALQLDVTFVQGDLLDAVPGELDAVLSNPPYVAKRDLSTLQPEVTAEPDVAVFGGFDGFEIVRRLVPAAMRRAPLVAIEVGMGMAQTVGGLLREAGASSVEVERDLAGIERVVVGRR